MKKIMDNSAISSMGIEIVCTNMLDTVSSQYDVLVTNAVLKECQKLGNSSLLNRVNKFNIAVQENDLFTSLVEAIKSINFRLGPGEIHTIAASLILTKNGIDNYVVIDESLARKIVKNIHLNPTIIKLMGNNLVPVKCTGTIGIIAHLRDKGIISKDLAHKIAYDLEISNFRVTDDLLNLLR